MELDGREIEGVGAGLMWGVLAGSVGSAESLFLGKGVGSLSDRIVELVAYVTETAVGAHSNKIINRVL